MEAMQVGPRIDEEGVLLRDGDVPSLRRDAGGRFLLDVRRVSIDPTMSRVRIIGTYVDDDLVDVDEIQAV